MANVTKLANLLNPEVLGDMINAEIEEKLNALPYLKVDNTLQGQAGDTITLPKWGYIGEAVDVAEGEEIPTELMSVTSSQHTIKMAGIGGTITDKAMTSGYGNPEAVLKSQISTSLMQKTNSDVFEALYGTSITYTAGGALGYNTLVNAIDAFEEEVNSEKVMWVHPKQVTQLRLDPDFIAKDKYGNQVMVDGEIGMVANTRIVPSKKVKKEGGYYFNPIVKLDFDKESESAVVALTAFLKRDVNIEVQRISNKRLTEVTGDKMYVIAVTNEEKVLIAKFKETASV